jgi:hypothetical protein
MSQPLPSAVRVDPRVKPEDDGGEGARKKKGPASPPGFRSLFNGLPLYPYGSIPVLEMQIQPTEASAT